MSKWILTDRAGNKYEVLVDKKDWYVMFKYKWTVYVKAGRPYVISGKNTPLHKVIFNREYKRPFCIDHINGNTLDNRKKNLRLVPDSHNVQNSKMFKTNSSGYRGVSYRKVRDQYEAYIMQNRKKIFLGYFDTAKEASKAYDEAARKLFGSCAFTNGSDKMKECNKCKQSKPLTDFYTFKRLKSDGTDLNYFASCKKCTSKRQMAHYRNNPARREAHYKYVKNWRLKNLEKARKYGRETQKARYAKNPEHVRLVHNASKTLTRQLKGESLEDILKSHRTWSQEFKEKVVQYIWEKRII